MDSAAQTLALLVMALFAAGVIGCAITIPVCAVKFFAILFEDDEEQSNPAAFAAVSPYPQTAVPAAAEAEAPGEEPSAPPRRRSRASAAP